MQVLGDMAVSEMLSYVLFTANISNILQLTLKKKNGFLSWVKNTCYVSF